MFRFIVRGGEPEAQLAGLTVCAAARGARHPDLGNRLMVFAVRLCPHASVRKLAGRLLR
jgi:hypothetical protein